MPRNALDRLGLAPDVNALAEPVAAPAQPDGDVPDYTSRYNTALSPAQEQQYQQWLQALSVANGRDMSRDSFDYDMRGAFASGAAQSANAHWPDTFKKPNHPSFSDQSQYHGVSGEKGGTWAQDQNGAWAFTPGATNMRLHGATGLQQYFQRGDPGVRLQLPE